MMRNKDSHLIYEVYVHQEGIASTIGHVALDLTGLIPAWGEIADGANALWYAGEGKYLQAALSLISMVPTIGDIVGKGGKLAILAAKGAKALKGTGTTGRAAAKGIVKGTQAARKGTAAVSPQITKIKTTLIANKQLIDGVFQKASENEKLAPHVKGMQDALGTFLGEGQAPAAPVQATPATPMPAQAIASGPVPGTTPATGLSQAA